jgi:hypothetical protein
MTLSESIRIAFNVNKPVECSHPLRIRELLDNLRNDYGLDHSGCYRRIVADVPELTEEMFEEFCARSCFGEEGGDDEFSTYGPYPPRTL